MFNKIILYLYTSLCFFLTISVNNAVHFRGGYISWQTVLPNATTGATVTINVEQTYSWAYSTYPCISPIGNANNLNCISSTCSNYVSSMISTQTPCISYDLGLGVSTGRSTTLVTLLSGAQLVIGYQSTFWLTLVSGASLAWSLVTYIDLTVRSDNGLINSSPTSSMTSIVTLLVSTQQILRIPLFDVDSDIIKCRWPNKTATILSTVIDECGGACLNVPGAQLYSSSNTDNNCTIVFTSTLVGYYVVALQIEDYMPSAPNGLPLSSVPLQFIVLAVNVSCNPPTIVGQLTDGTTVQVEANKTSSVTILAEAGCNTSIINRFSTIVLPSSTALVSTVTSLGSMLYSIVLTWTPTFNQVGTTQSYCTLATDSNDLQSAQYCVHFLVIMITTTTTTTTTSSTSTSTSTSTTSSTSTSTSTTTTASTSTSTSTTTTSTTFTTTATTATTGTSTISPTVVVSVTQTSDNLRLELELGLGLGIPLLLLLSALSICALCRYGPGLFWKQLRHQFWKEEIVECQRCQNRHVYKLPLNDNSQTPPNDSSKDYRRQYVNDDPVAPNERLSIDSSWSSSPSDLGWMTATRTTFMSCPSNKVMPIEDVRLPMTRPVKQHKSFLVNAFVEQEGKGNMSSLP